MFNPAISKLTAPPVSVVQDWRASYDGSRGALIDMSQAVPGYAAHADMTAALEAAAGTLGSSAGLDQSAASFFPQVAPSAKPKGFGGRSLA